MRSTILAMALFLAVLPASADRAEPVTFTGEYQWKQGGDDTLIAEFTPDGDDRWKVKFRFDWSGNNYTWKGDASGPLTEGSEFSGTARSKDGRREWRFSGTLESGVLRGKHTETTDGRSYETGTFELRR